MTTPTFTFAIVNWNTRDLLRQCLDSIRAHGAHYDIQILVADNASSDGSAEMVEGSYPEVTLVRNPGNLGFAKGHAPLFELSRGRYHVLVNSDVRLHPGCLERIEERMERDPDIGVLGPRTIGPDGQVQPGCRRFPSLAFQFREALGINRLFPRHPWWNAYKMGDFDHGHSRDVDQIMGSFFVIRDSLVRNIGGLDTSFFMYYEEVDYCLRAKRAGFRVFFEAGAEVYHEGGASAAKVKVQTIRRIMRSMRHYYRKNHGGWTWLPLTLILSLDSATHVAYALARRQQPLTTFKAYWLAWWDVVLFRPADF
ncbi:Glycosyltransferase family 2 protein [Sulfidibacter corallicola]|uniref:Glycosyltransferase family 2 protein n=1 Tax=Sulfidibacter corallicola TaxID=2818388 RepID=A0A8A4TXX3_SULCO|nr:glycosyltransferase family 2 protein [Sulfidibacter corallicola]QTD54058.1 glycosyltransferase family 2 protein [Sulfidibacter corallicola]